MMKEYTMDEFKAFEKSNRLIDKMVEEAKPLVVAKPQRLDNMPEWMLERTWMHFLE